MNCKLSLLLLLLLLAPFHANAQRDRAAERDTLALTPPMGWNSWNLFEWEVSDSLLLSIADAMASTEMRDAEILYPATVVNVWTNKIEKKTATMRGTLAPHACEVYIYRHK